MTEQKDGGPAFPSPTANPIQNGQLTVRDYFAAQAMSQLLHIRGYGGDADSKRRIAAEAYDFADAMLAERAE